MVDQDPEGPDPERGESEAEREDRKWDDMLQELRVIQTGTQLTAGFLLTLPFQQRFEDLSTFQQRYYLALVLLAAVVTALVLTPISIHRRLAGRRVKGRLVASAHIAMQAVLVTLGMLLVGITGFIFDVVVSGTVALVAAGAVALLLLSLLVLVPRSLVD
jgi:hypothetical protein